MTLMEPTAYDCVTYPSNPFARTSPHCLATIARLHGMAPALPSRCRVLELGCGAGGNLIPMAYQAPASTFVGIDMSREAVGAGQRTTSALGLANISLQHRDIMEIAQEDGCFDYIIAHGVYSWVPHVVRDKILSVFKTNLAPNGIACVSYNALPGSRLRDLVRSIMLFHVRNLADPWARSAQSRSLMKFLATASAHDQVYGIVLRDQQHRIESLPDEVFIHDLDEGATPFFLHEVVEAAARRGLQYLADTDFPILGLHGRSEEICNMLSRIPETDAAVREQYLDFIDGRCFRTSVFCHQDVRLTRPPAAATVRELYLSGGLSLEDPAASAAGDNIAVFKAPSGATLKTNHPLSKSALFVLGQVQPEAIGFDDIMARALEHLERTEASISGDDIEMLSSVLFQAVRTGLLEAYVEPPPVTGAVSARPRASALARWQASSGSEFVTNLLHGSVKCTDDVLRRFIPLVDGTRSADELRSGLRDALGEDACRSVDTTPRAVQRTLTIMAQLALLDR